MVESGHGTGSKQGRKDEVADVNGAQILNGL